MTFWHYLIIALLCRGYDLLLTWLITPSLKRERNLFIRTIGWYGWIVLSLVLCVVFAMLAEERERMPLYVLCIISLLAALWNFRVLFGIRAKIVQYSQTSCKRPI